MLEKSRQERNRGKKKSDRRRGKRRVCVSVCVKMRWTDMDFQAVCFDARLEGDLQRSS